MIASPHRDLDLDDPRNWRTRTSIHVEMGGHHIQVDAAQEFRLQCLHHHIGCIDTFILTHGHADHILGMDDLRRFCDLRKGRALPVYSTLEGLGRVAAIFPYAIREHPEFPGYPAFSLRPMPDRLDLGPGTVTSCLLPHGRVQVLGLIFEERATGSKLAYFTDCHTVPEEAMDLARGAEVVVLDALRPNPHPTHQSVEEAIAMAHRIGAPLTYFIHMTGLVDHASTEATLPPGIRLSYDGLRLALPSGRSLRNGSEEREGADPSLTFGCKGRTDGEP